MSRLTPLLLAAALALPATASAGEWLTVTNDGLTSSVQLELVSSHCVDGTAGLHNYVLAPTDSLEVKPTPSREGECSWDVVNQDSAWHAAVYATTPGRGGDRVLLGFVQGNGTNDLAWMPFSDDERFVVVTIRDTVGSLNVFVQQARLSPEDRKLMAALEPR
jgi:hypothetical protein